jgi:ribosomal protein S18 acetylase RimI-like enzyme
LTRRFELRDYRAEDADAVNATVIAAFGEFDPALGVWPTATRGSTNTTELAAVAELIVATVDGVVAGCIGYVAPGVAKQDYFEREWPVIRRLAVRPDYRGLGIGSALTAECVARARRDGATLIALHSTRLMDVAIGMYERMGFAYLRDAPSIGGLPYGIWVKYLVR